MKTCPWDKEKYFSKAGPNPPADPVNNPEGKG
jgi:hypothetical protein